MADEPVICAVCGAAPRDAGATPPLTWSCQTSARGTRWTCTDCTRLHVRSIEAKLDPEWW